MQGFNQETKLTIIVCRANAILIVPLIFSLGYFVLLIAPILIVPALVFYIMMVYGLLAIRKWSRWLILIEALATFSLIFAFRWEYAGLLFALPGYYAYNIHGQIVGYSDPFNIHWIVFFAFSFKVLINTFNIFFFFGNHIFNLAQKYRLAHALWIIPSAIFVGLPIYQQYRHCQYEYTKNFGTRPFSKSANKIAEEEFRKITCDMVRKNRGRNPVRYQINNHDVKIDFDPRYVRVRVFAPDGTQGMYGECMSKCFDRN